ncbi:hypothetical protein BKA70DRAFT_1243472 [Coprinopsis sp. MPI-PUGE-AT-0042]|nr:hypothetical protein BKA70DRAFT_1243472 [Coprinopsis sp. MPI-PUGE-AT-0042]
MADSEVQTFPLHGKPMATSFARTRSDAGVKKVDADSFDSHKERRLDPKMDGSATMPQTKRPAVQMSDEYLSPNRVLFLQNLPESVTKDQLMSLFSQYPNLHEVRLIPTKKDNTFVKYLDEGSAGVARDALYNFKLNGENKIKAYLDLSRLVSLHHPSYALCTSNTSASMILSTSVRHGQANRASGLGLSRPRSTFDDLPRTQMFLRQQRLARINRNGASYWGAADRRFVETERQTRFQGRWKIRACFGPDWELCTALLLNLAFIIVYFLDTRVVIAISFGFAGIGLAQSECSGQLVYEVKKGNCEASLPSRVLMGSCGDDPTLHASALGNMGQRHLGYSPAVLPTDFSLPRQILRTICYPWIGKSLMEVIDERQTG